MRFSLQNESVVETLIEFRGFESLTFRNKNLKPPITKIRCNIPLQRIFVMSLFSRKSCQSVIPPLSHHAAVFQPTLS